AGADGQGGPRPPAGPAPPCARRRFVSTDVFAFESILKLIEYRFGLSPLTRRDAYARNIGRSFDWESKPRLQLPAPPDPPGRLSDQCSRRQPSALYGGDAERPKPHDMSLLLTSGYLDGLGFDYKPAQAATTVRNPR